MQNYTLHRSDTKSGHCDKSVCTFALLVFFLDYFNHSQHAEIWYVVIQIYDSGFAPALVGFLISRVSMEELNKIAAFCP